MSRGAVVDRRRRSSCTLRGSNLTLSRSPLRWLVPRDGRRLWATVDSVQAPPSEPMWSVAVVGNPFVVHWVVEPVAPAKTRRIPTGGPSAATSREPTHCKHCHLLLLHQSAMDYVVDSPRISEFLPADAGINSTRADVTSSSNEAGPFLLSTGWINPDVIVDPDKAAARVPSLRLEVTSSGWKERWIGTELFT